MQNHWPKGRKQKIRPAKSVVSGRSDWGSQTGVLAESDKSDWRKGGKQKVRMADGGMQKIRLV
jgi:hypothetical protein